MIDHLTSQQFYELHKCVTPQIFLVGSDYEFQAELKRANYIEKCFVDMLEGKISSQEMADKLEFCGEIENFEDYLEEVEINLENLANRTKWFGAIWEAS